MDLHISADHVFIVCGYTEPETTVCPECGSTLSPVGEEF